MPFKYIHFRFLSLNKRTISACVSHFILKFWTKEKFTHHSQVCHIIVQSNRLNCLLFPNEKNKQMEIKGKSVRL